MLAPSPKFALNTRHRAGAMSMLATLPYGCAALAVFDPQYRGVLDRQKYGNEGARQIRRAQLPSMSYGAITAVLTELERVLKPSGHVVLWADKFTVASGHHCRWVPEGLETVGMIAWNKGRPGMGWRERCRTEYALILQKPPLRAKGVWTDKSLDDCWLEQVDTREHPHAKPLMLTQRLIKAVTKRGDLVVDPCAGGYGVLQSCQATGRRFIGCDIAGPQDA